MREFYAPLDDEAPVTYGKIIDFPPVQPYEGDAFPILNEGWPTKWPKASGTVYLSGPITGLGYGETRFGWRQEVACKLNPAIKVLSPMRHEGHLSEISGEMREGITKHYFSGAAAIVGKDKLDIQRSDIIFVNLLGAKAISKGTIAEIGMGFALGKSIVLVIEDTGNIHDAPFIFVPAMLRLNNLADAIEATNSLLSEGI